jgi:hypothetical protein
MPTQRKSIHVEKVLDILNRVDDYVLPIDDYLNRTYGKGTWRYDPYAGQYVVCDQRYTGPGRGYVIVAPDTREFPLILDEAHLH